MKMNRIAIVLGAAWLYGSLSFADNGQSVGGVGVTVAPADQGVAGDASTDNQGSSNVSQNDASGTKTCPLGSHFFDDECVPNAGGPVPVVPPICDPGPAPRCPGGGKPSWDPTPVCQWVCPACEPPPDGTAPTCPFRNNNEANTALTGATFVPAVARWDSRRCRWSCDPHRHHRCEPEGTAPVCPAEMLGGAPAGDATNTGTTGPQAQWDDRECRWSCRYHHRRRPHRFCDRSLAQPVCPAGAGLKWNEEECRWRCIPQDPCGGRCTANEQCERQTCGWTGVACEAMTLPWQCVPRKIQACLLDCVAGYAPFYPTPGSCVGAVCRPVNAKQ